MNQFETSLEHEFKSQVSQAPTDVYLGKAFKPSTIQLHPVSVYFHTFHNLLFVTYTVTLVTLLNYSVHIYYPDVVLSIAAKLLPGYYSHKASKTTWLLTLYLKGLLCCACVLVEIWAVFAGTSTCFRSGQRGILFTLHSLLFRLTWRTLGASAETHQRRPCSSSEIWSEGRKQNTAGKKKNI